MSYQPQPLAIVGIGCRFPSGVTDTDSYWELLIKGRSGITHCNWPGYGRALHAAARLFEWNK